MKNHESRSTGSTPFPQVNATIHNNYKKNLCMNGHWSHTCCMPKHLVKLYQTSIQTKRKNIETNLAYQNDNVETNFAHKDDGFKNFVDMTYLNVKDFFKARNKKNYII
ncbi:hypothetical protein ERO13_D13G127566v2 [Gossypium hirsutum]|uniref:Uncharacterized protein n=2 Tax=Gossypium TaxID=3633 RepID=A0A5J5NLK7_GOSBA|nr:hypothetical protein ES319_D13G145100v1 [Gossypium barbadense]KAG4111854.1 hypothetical protein ERO13_D13G127566v2 [Gossypium hirsutum]TYG37609.1 hypothetical protein ES288_D13G154800v1 [Gossypium darwinii]